MTDPARLTNEELEAELANMWMVSMRATRRQAANLRGGRSWQSLITNV
jgi:hypothetical protein